MSGLKFYVIIKKVKNIKIKKMGKIKFLQKTKKLGSTFGSIKPMEQEREDMEESNKNKPFSVRFCNWLISASLFLIFLGTPLFFLGLTSQGLAFEKYIFFYAFLLVGLIAWATRGIIEGQVKIKRSLLDWPALFFIGSVVVSTIFSVDKNTSIFGAYGSPGKGLIGLLALFVFVYFLASNFNRARRGQILLAIAISNILFVASFFIAQIWPTIGSVSFAAGFNTVGTSGASSVFISALLPLLLVAILGVNLFWQKSKAMSVAIKTVLLVALLGNLFYLFAINGFVFWPAAILGILVLLIFLISKVIKVKQTFVSWPIAVFLILVFFYVVGSINILPVNIPAEVGLTSSTSWDVAKNSLKDNLIFGSGPSTFKFDFAQFKPADFNLTSAWNVYFDSAQGIFFEVVATLGLVGTLTLILLLGSLLFVAVFGLIKAQKISDKLFISGATGSFAVIFVSAFFLTFNSILILLSFLLGALLYASILASKGFKFPTINLSLKASPQNAIALATTFLFISAGVVVFFALLTRAFVADFYAYKAAQAQTLEDAATQITRSIRLVDYRATYYSRLGQYYMALVNQEANKPAQEADSVAALSYLQAAISASRQALSLTPNDVEAVGALASIYENATLYISDANSFAVDYYNRMMELEPINPIPHIRLAVLKTAEITADTTDEQKNKILTEAIVKYQKALELKPDLAGVYSGISFAYEAMGDFEKAISNMVQAINLAPDDLGYRFELARLYYNHGVEKGTVVQQQQQQLIEGQTPEQQEVSVQPQTQSSPYVQPNDDLAVAERILVNLTDVYPDYANAHYLLAMLYERTREFAAAKVRYQATADLLPEGETKSALQQKANSL